MLGNLAILGVVAVIAMFLAWWFGDTVLRRPISQLVDAAQQLGTGKLHVRTGLHHSPVNWVSWLDLLMTWQCCWKKGFASAKPRREVLQHRERRTGDAV